jgi:hypothetical protein
MKNQNWCRFSEPGNQIPIRELPSHPSAAVTASSLTGLLNKSRMTIVHLDLHYSAHKVPILSFNLFPVLN